MPVRKLSTPRSRSELIAAYGARAPFATVVAPAVPADPKPAPEDGDAAVSDAIAAIKAALDKAQAAQKADPDAGDPNDEKVQAGLDALAQTLAQLEKDQAVDSAAGDPAPVAKAPAPKVAAAIATTPPAATDAGTAPAGVIADNGDVDDDAVCTNPDCGHLASAHENDAEAGQNTGTCQMANCVCPGMVTDANMDTVDSGDQGAEASSGSVELAPAGVAADAPMPAEPATGPAPNLNAPPQIAGSENMGPAFSIPVLVIEGQPTGDGRQIAAGALTWRVPPLPLMGLATETHDPEGYDLNDPAVLCGRIDTLTRTAGEGDTQLIVANGFYLPNDDGMYFAGLTEAMGRCGISADIAVQASEIEVGEIDDDGWPSDMSEILTDGQIMGATQVPFPASEGAYIVLGDGSAKPEVTAIPQAAESPVVPATPPAAVLAGGQLVHLMSYEQCERCDQGLETITASGAGPTAPPASWFADPNFTPGDGRLEEILDRRGDRTIAGKYACPLTITADGRVFGHLAPWDTCHIGKPGCVTAPHSKSGYAYFKRGQHVVCADGSSVRVGTLTVDAGHAGMTDSATSAMAHYDNIATATADVNCGEDEHGIWVAGAIRPTASEAQVIALRASSISGDWRGLGGSLELVAALAVPVPGFPHAVVASGQEETLVASGASVMHRLKHPVTAEAEQGDVALRRAMAPLLGQARSAARERLSSLTKQ